MNVPKKAPFSQVISEKNLDRQTNRLKDKQIGTQVDRQIDRQIPGGTNIDNISQRVYYVTRVWNIVAKSAE